MMERKPGVAGVLVAMGKMAAYLALFLGCQMAVTYVYMIQVIGEMGPDSIQDPGFLNAVYERTLSASIPLTLVSGLATLAVLAVVYLAIRRMRPQDAFWLRPVKGSALWAGAALAPALYVLVTAVMAIVPQGLLDDYNQAASGLDEAGVLAFLCVVIVSPVVEEIIFRGLIMTRLARAMSPLPAVILSAAVFGLCHGQFLWFCYAFVLGMVFGLLDMRARSILPSILAHVAFNLIGQIFTILDHVFPEERWVVPAMAAMFLAGLLGVFVCRKNIAAFFRPLPSADAEDAAAPAAPPVALYAPQAGEGEVFGGGETCSWRDDVTEQNPWRD